MELNGLDIVKFDMEKYLQDKRIDYVLSGFKNVAQGWIGLSCPFCPDGDPSYHLGLNLRDKGLSCWRCGVRGGIAKYIMKTERISFEEATIIIKEYAGTLSDKVYPSKANEHARKLDFPFTMTPELTAIHKKYLEERNLYPEEMYKKFSLQSILPGNNDWSNRIYIPVILKGKTIAYTARATTKTNIPYKNAKDSDCLVSIKESFYNFDTVKDVAVVVEGPGDVWNTGDGFIATFGTKFTKNQIYILSKLRKVFILFDSEKKDKQAPKKAKELCLYLNASTDVEILELSEGDPGDMKKEDVKSLRNMIFGKVY